MATTLVTLPDETLSQILSYIDTNKAKRCNQRYRRTICALARTNRRLFNISHVELYRHIVLDIDEEHLTPWTPKPSFVNKFLRTCRERPSLLHHIQRIDITWSLDEDEDDLLEALLCQFARSTSLTHLHLNIEDIQFELSVSPCPIRPLLQRDQSFLHLQVLELISSHVADTMPAEILYSLASLPSLQTLHISCAISQPEDETFHTSPQDTDFGQTLDLKNQPFNLETLEVVKSIHNDVLGLILSRCPKLKHLTALPIGIHDDEFSSAFYFGDEANSTPGHLSPRNLTTSLLPVHSTLQSLTLSGEPIHATTWQQPNQHPHNNSIINLSPFKSLTHLNISTILLSQDNQKTLEPEFLRTMFPVSLEHLEFHLEYPHGLFWAAIVRNPTFFTGGLHQSGTTISPADFTRRFTETLTHDSFPVRAGLRWYLSLLSARKKSSPKSQQSSPRATTQFESKSTVHMNSILPNLRTLKIIELGDNNGTWGTLELGKRGYCPDLFWGLGVDFEVCLRVPVGWEVPGG